MKKSNFIVENHGNPDLSQVIKVSINSDKPC
jgi:hypothetical protein